MQKKYMVLGGLVLASLMLVATTLMATAGSANGPFQIIPGNAHCGEADEFPVPLPGEGASCNAWGGLTYNYCCNWGDQRAQGCAASSGNNCYVYDHYQDDPNCCVVYE